MLQNYKQIFRKKKKNHISVVMSGGRGLGGSIYDSIMSASSLLGRMGNKFQIF